MIENEAIPIKTRMKYVCPEKNCNLIPEIISANSDIGIIVLKCEKHGKKEIDVEKYLKILDGKTNAIPPSTDFDVPEEKDLESSRKLILDKSKDLSSIIKAHIKILDSQEKNPDNYFHNQNVINLGYFLEDESKNYIYDKEEQKIKTIDDIRKEEIKDKNEEENDALEELKNKFFVDHEKYLRKKEKKEEELIEEEKDNKKKVEIEEPELYLKLKGPKKESKYIKYLKDEGFKLISKLRFKNLKELNLANNQITSLDPLNNMLLPHLEIINFGDNQIKEIDPLANLFSKNLSEIYLQKNKIEDLGPFLNSDFPLLEIFRVDGKGNGIAFKKKSFRAVQVKYKGILFYEAKSWESFNKEYEYNGDGDDENYQKLFKIDLGSRRKDKILIDLFPLILYPNNIKYLILDDNKLQDVSLLNRMPLYNLEHLDLSLNFIVNIKFLKKMSKKCEFLKTLYLNDNKINDISPLIQYSENNTYAENKPVRENNDDGEKKPNSENNADGENNSNNEKEGPKLIIDLEALTLKNNCLDLKDKTTKSILEMLIGRNEDKKITVDYEKKDLDTPDINHYDDNAKNRLKRVGADSN